MAQIDEGRMKDIFTADQEGKSAKEIAKRLNIPLGTVKKILGEEEELKEFTNAQLDSLAKSYASMQGKTISIPNANKLRKIFDRIPDGRLNDLRKKKIPFLSGLALSRMIQKGIPVREAFAVQITKKDGGKLIHGKYKDKAAADKFIKWYKTGDMKDTKSIEVVKEDVYNEDDINWAGKLEEDSNKTYQVKDKTGKVVFTGKYNQVLSYRKKNGGEIVTEDKDGKAYAIGMAKAKEVMKDEPPLEKKTITKAHDIAKAVQRNESKQKPYVSSSGGQYSVLDGDGKEVYKTSNKQLAHAWFKKNYDNIKEVIRIRPKNAIGEKKSAYRLSYEKDGKHAGFEDADTLSDLQNKAQKLRAKGFKIVKMGRNTSPVEQRLPEPEGKYEVGEAKGVTLDKTGKAAILYQVTANVPKQMSTDGKTVMVRPGIKKYDVEGRNKQDAIKRFARYFKMKSTSGIKAVPDPRSEIEKYYYVPRSRIKMWNYGGEDKKGNTLYIKSDYEPMGETILEYTTKQIKQAYGILNDPRYKQGNYSGAYKAIEKIAKGLAKHKDVANALRRANEEYVHPGKATFERIWREVSDKLKLKVLDRKIKRTKDKFYKNLRRP